MGNKGFNDLVVWQSARNLAVLIYKVFANTNNMDFRLRDQLRRSAASVGSNLAEGDKRDPDKESIRYSFIAKGSVADLPTQLQIAQEGFVKAQAYKTPETEHETLAKRVGKLIQTRRHTARL